MVSTYSEIKNGLDGIADENRQGKVWAENSRTKLVSAQTLLAGMTAKYSALIADINAAVIANPTDEAYLFAKSEKDKLVADFQSLKNYVDALIVAFDAV